MLHQPGKTVDFHAARINLRKSNLHEAQGAVVCAGMTSADVGAEVAAEEQEATAAVKSTGLKRGWFRA
jgi:hypothetical protein